MSPEREEEKKKMPFIVANYVYASSQGQRTHSARTNNCMREELSMKTTASLCYVFLTGEQSFYP
jgi:hypothetical protein